MITDELLKEFQNWYLMFKKEHKKAWDPKNDILFYTASKTFKRLLEKTERSIDEKIDKEITKKKQDRAILMKAKRLTKGKNVEAKYIDIRFKEEWDKASENELEPVIAGSMDAIVEQQKIYQKKLDDHDPHFDPNKDPRYNK
tara:strand:- start:128 stop:553 length:426 start_codon:yes stop_codon:yes gene_type:complete